jgi:hypothetical protein
MDTRYSSFQLIGRGLMSCFIMLFLIMGSNTSWAIEFDAKPGLDPQGNWVDSNLVRCKRGMCQDEAG